FVQEVLSMVIYGYAPVEIILKERQGEKPDKRFSSRYDDGMIGIRKLAIRSQETILRWIMSDDQNDILGARPDAVDRRDQGDPAREDAAVPYTALSQQPRRQVAPAKRISKLLLR